jgi:hypothetical protein
MDCINVDSSLHDKISSLAVGYVPQHQKAKGVWVERYSGPAKTSYTVTTEMGYTSTTDTTTSLQDTLSAEMDMGFAFGDASVSNEFSYGLTSETTSTMS